MFINEAIALIEQIANIVSKYVMVSLLFFVGAYLSIYTGFIQIRRFPRFFDFLYVKKDSGAEITPVQSFLLALGGRVGLGNIVGVSFAIIMGGPGALFWMWFACFITMVVNTFESTLAQMYKEKSQHSGSDVSGPVYYITKGIGGSFRYLGYFSAAMLPLAMIAMNFSQANFIASYYGQVIQDVFVKYGFLSVDNPQQLTQTFEYIKIAAASFFAILFFIVVFKGLKSVASVCDVIVPVMVFTYIFMGLYVILANITMFPYVISTVVKSAFGYMPVIGGVGGFTLLNSLAWGVRRTVHSSEVGIGTMSTLSTGDVDHPVQEGYSQTLGFMIDTLFCSITAFIILSAGYPNNLFEIQSVVGSTGKQMSVLLFDKSMGYHFGSWSTYLMLTSATLFAFTSLLGNYTIGERNLQYFFSTAKSKKNAIFIYQLIVMLLIIFASVLSIQTVINITDILLGLCVVSNLLGIFVLRKQVMDQIYDYDKFVLKQAQTSSKTPTGSVKSEK